MQPPTKSKLSLSNLLFYVSSKVSFLPYYIKRFKINFVHFIFKILKRKIRLLVIKNSACIIK